METTQLSSLLRGRKVSAETYIIDTVLATGLTLFVWIQLSTARLVFYGHGMMRPGGPFAPFFMRQVQPTPLTYLLAAACLLPLAARRARPLVVLGIVTIASLFFEVLRHPPAFTVLGPLIALYTVGTLHDRRTTIAAWLVTSAVLLGASLPAVSDTRFVTEFVRIIAMFGVAAALGDSARNRRAYIVEVERRAAEAEALAEEEARRRVDEERLRIARELHDITAHSMSVIAVQSGMASHVIERDPEAARRALEDIRTTSKQALQELRSVLGALRAEGETAAPLAPTPGLDRLPELVRVAEEAGFRVRLDVTGDLATLPQLADASAYRILQEAVTNALRHADPSEIAIAVAAGEDALSLEVVNAGVRDQNAPEGHGVAGMRERAIALGGTFSAGPQPDRRWRVAATLPLRANGESNGELA